MTQAVMTLNRFGGDVRESVQDQVDKIVERNVTNGHLKTLLSVLGFIVILGSLVRL